MPALPFDSPLLPARPEASRQLRDAALVYKTQEEWQLHLCSLQEFICDLLITNQRLRMALMEIEKTYRRDSDGGEI
jgi:hypothetical protein